MGSHNKDKLHLNLCLGGAGSSQTTDNRIAVVRPKMTSMYSLPYSLPSNLKTLCFVLSLDVVCLPKYRILTLVSPP